MNRSRNQNGDIGLLNIENRVALTAALGRGFIAFLMTVCLLVLLIPRTGYMQSDRPITKENLLRSLEENGKVPTNKRTGPSRYTELIKQHGVDFEITPTNEQEIRQAGAYLGTKGLDDLIASVRKNYRPPADVCIGRPTGDSPWFSVNENYTPSGKFGDIDDVQIMSGDKSDLFVYTATGQGQHEWDLKYVGDLLNPKPAQFGGVMYLDPPNNFGAQCGGFDVRKFRRVIKWEARSLKDAVYVQFIIGGISWIWDDVNKKRIAPPYSDSMPRTNLGTKEVTTKWQSFEYPLSGRLNDDKYFTRVLNGFAWQIQWGANGVELGHTKTFKIEIRNIHYER